MPALSAHHSSKIVKMMYLGDSSSGKTGSLVSLVKAGYRLRILDLDNGLDVLAAFIRQECPDKMDQVDYITLRDKYKASSQGPIIDGTAKAFIKVTEFLNKWEDGSSPSEWDDKTIFVLDSLSALGQAAFEWAKGMNPGAKEPRTYYFVAQQAIEKIIAMLTSEAFKPNVIIITHVQYKESDTGPMKGYANAIGSALGPIIPKYFNTMVMSLTSGSGGNIARSIQTISTSTVDLKNPAPFKVEVKLPLSSGLATLFEKLKS